MAQAPWPAQAAREVGRTSERQRFQRVGPHHARESALEPAGFSRLADGSWAARGASLLAPESDNWVDDALQPGAALDWGADLAFPEAPAELLRSRR